MQFLTGSDLSYKDSQMTFLKESIYSFLESVDWKHYITTLTLFDFKS